MSIASANEVKDAIAKQNANEDTTEADYQKAVTFLKNAEDAVEA